MRLFPTRFRQQLVQPGRFTCASWRTTNHNDGEDCKLENSSLRLSVIAEQQKRAFVALIGEEDYEQMKDFFFFFLEKSADAPPSLRAPTKDNNLEDNMHALYFCLRSFELCFRVDMSCIAFTSDSAFVSQLPMKTFLILSTCESRILSMLSRSRHNYSVSLVTVGVSTGQDR